MARLLTSPWSRPWSAGPCPRPWSPAPAHRTGTGQMARSTWRKEYVQVHVKWLVPPEEENMYRYRSNGSFHLKKRICTGTRQMARSTWRKEYVQVKVKWLVPPEEKNMYRYRSNGSFHLKKTYVQVQIKWSIRLQDQNRLNNNVSGLLYIRVKWPFPSLETTQAQEMYNKWLFHLNSPGSNKSYGSNGSFLRVDKILAQ
jgi:hypothetical protein